MEDAQALVWRFSVALAIDAGTPAVTGGTLDTLLWRWTWKESGEDLGVRADSHFSIPVSLTQAMIC